MSFVNGLGRTGNKLLESSADSRTVDNVRAQMRAFFRAADSHAWRVLIAPLKLSRLPINRPRDRQPSQRDHRAEGERLGQIEPRRHMRKRLRTDMRPYI